MFLYRFLIVATLLFSSVACTRPQAGEESSKSGLQGRLPITGSSTVAPLASEIAKRFEVENPGVRIDVQAGGSSRGIADVRRGTADIGMVSRALKPNESDLTAHTVALDGISLIAHAANSVTGASAAQVVSVYTGKNKTWSFLGGGDREVTIVNKAEGRSTLELFLEHFELTNSQIVADVVIGGNQEGIKTVAGNENALGYVSIGTATYEAGRGTPIRLLHLDGVEPTLENVRSGKYPLIRPLNFVTKGKTTPLTDAFLRFARSRAVIDLIEGQYFVAPSE